MFCRREHDIDEAFVCLSKKDASTGATSSDIVTCTFFAADFDQLRCRLRSKLLEVVRANPWLLGRFTRGTKHIVCPTRVPENSDETLLDTSGLWLLDGNTATEDSCVSRSSPYPALNKAVMDLLGSMGAADSMNAFKDNRPPSESSLLRCKMVRVNSEESAFLFGMSHFIGDGHTYYKLLNMLGPDTTIETMEIRRVVEGRRSQADVDAAEQSITGKQNSSYQRSITCMKHLIWDNAMGRARLPSQGGLFFVDNEKVAKKKADVLQHIEVNGEQSPVQFVSTSDIIASEFAITSGADLFWLMVNGRKYVGRLTSDTPPPYGDLDAGNYQLVCTYDRTSFASPVEIRKSLVQKKESPVIAKSCSNDFPGLFESPQISLMTNWVFPLNLDGADAKTLLHLPCLKMPNGANYLTAILDYAVLFNATPERLGLLVQSSNVAAAAFANESSVLAHGILEAGATFDIDSF